MKAQARIPLCGTIVCVVLGLGMAPSVARAATPGSVHHDIAVTLSPVDHAITVTDAILFDVPRTRYVFALHRDLSVIVNSPQAKLRKSTTQGCGIAVDDALAVCYEIMFSKPAGSVSLRYSGAAYAPLGQQATGIPLGEASGGIVSDGGVFLDSSSHWYPVGADDLVTFSLDAQVPGGWDVVSQGKRVVHVREDDVTRVVWQADRPQDDIYLVAGKYHEYAAKPGQIELQVFLRSPDGELAQRYLDAGAEYLDMYADLVGPYPYEKFAVVENFRETGYGMPSFTLLGARVIRFPFILHSSYPHEILHNWWGNGVYVNYSQGNWSEGLTSYLADHLIREQHGAGVEYRRAALQKYRDHVASNNEFALAQFTGRHSSASEAVGYGKTMMLFHMLRQRVGDASFMEALRKFYADNLHRRATFSDIRAAFEATTGRRYQAFFTQWTERTGAPQLRVNDLVVTRAGGGYRLEFELEQTQADAPYELSVPLAITLEGVDDAYQTRLEMKDGKTRARYAFAERPLRVDIDPEFDLFRILAPDERPATLSQIFGARRITIILPGKAPGAMLRRYRAMADAWPSEQDTVPEVVSDQAIAELPGDGAVIVVGRENRFRDEVLRSAGASIDGTGDLVIGDQRFTSAGLSAAVVTTDVTRQHSPAMWLSSALPEALPGLLRKLPHYGKYSYVLFSGNEPENTDSGVWPVTGSSMSAFIQYDDHPAHAAPRARMKKSPSLTDAGLVRE